MVRLLKTSTLWLRLIVFFDISQVTFWISRVWQAQALVHGFIRDS